MIAAFKKLPEALQALVAVLSALVPVLQRACSEAAGLSASSMDTEELEQRLEALELEQRKWHARVEAELIRADGIFKAARSAEERARGMEKRAQLILGSDEEGDGDEDRDEWGDLLSRSYAGGGQENGVHPVRSGMEDEPPRRTPPSGLPPVRRR